MPETNLNNIDRNAFKKILETFYEKNEITNTFLSSQEFGNNLFFLIKNEKPRLQEQFHNRYVSQTKLMLSVVSDDSKKEFIGLINKTSEKSSYHSEIVKANNYILKEISEKKKMGAALDSREAPARETTGAHAPNRTAPEVPPHQRGNTRQSPPRRWDTAQEADAKAREEKIRAEIRAKETAAHVAPKKPLADLPPHLRDDLTNAVIDIDVAILKGDVNSLKKHFILAKIKGKPSITSDVLLNEGIDEKYNIRKSLRNITANPEAMTGALYAIAAESVTNGSVESFLTYKYNTHTFIDSIYNMDSKVARDEQKNTMVINTLIHCVRDKHISVEDLPKLSTNQNYRLNLNKYKDIIKEINDKKLACDLKPIIEKLSIDYNIIQEKNIIGPDQKLKKIRVFREI